MAIDIVVKRRAVGWIVACFTGLLLGCLPQGIYELTPPAGASMPIRFEVDLEVINGLLAAGWTKRGPVAYTHITETEGAQTLLRLSRGSEVRFAIDGSQRAQQLMDSGFGEPVDFGFVLPSTSGLPKIPLYALTRPSDGSVQLTTRKAERDQLLGEGFTLDTLGVSEDGVIALAPFPLHRLRCPTVGCPDAKGLSIVIHGGGFQDESDGALPPRNTPSEEPTFLDVGIIQAEAEQRWLDRGWAAVSISHRSSREGPANEVADQTFGGEAGSRPAIPGTARYSIEDALYFYDHLEEILGEELAAKPRCATGYSAGGHLSMVLAAANPGLRCVVADGAPTNLRDAPLLGDPDPDDLGDRLGSFAQFAFGAPTETSEGYLAPEFSPFLFNFDPEQELLLGFADGDKIVGIGHKAAFDSTQARDGVVTVKLRAKASGLPSKVFVHSVAVEEDLASYRALEDELADRTAAAPGE